MTIFTAVRYGGCSNRDRENATADPSTASAMADSGRDDTFVGMSASGTSRLFLTAAGYFHSSRAWRVF
jgi:hypothetical protein